MIQNFGNTISEIKNDGFKITKEVDIKVTDPNYDNPSHESIQRVLL